MLKPVDLVQAVLPVESVEAVRVINRVKPTEKVRTV